MPTEMLYLILECREFFPKLFPVLTKFWTKWAAALLLPTMQIGSCTTGWNKMKSHRDTTFL